MVADHEQGLDTRDGTRIGRGAAGHDADHRDPPCERIEGSRGAIDQRHATGIGHDRREGPVEVGEQPGRLGGQRGPRKGEGALGHR